MYLLFLGSRYLNELTTNFDGDLDFPFCLGQPRKWLEDISSICNNTDGLLGKMQLAQVEVRLEILECAEEQIVNRAWV